MNTLNRTLAVAIAGGRSPVETRRPDCANTHSLADGSTRHRKDRPPPCGSVAEVDGAQPRNPSSRLSQRGMMAA